MHDELQRVAACSQWLAAVGEDGYLPADRLDRAIAAGAIAARLVSTAVLGQVDVMPAGRDACQIRIAVAQAIGPIGDAGQRGVGFARQQAVHFAPRCGRQLCIGQPRDQAMALWAPGVGGQGGEAKGNGDAASPQG